MTSFFFIFHYSNTSFHVMQCGLPMLFFFVVFYGVLNFSIGWIVFKLRSVGDGRVGKLIAESFAVCYSLQTLVILRAQMTNPKGHDLWHWLLFIIYLGFAAIYSHLRFANGGNKIKVFELPGQRDHND